MKEERKEGRNTRKEKMKRKGIRKEEGMGDKEWEEGHKVRKGKKIHEERKGRGKKEEEKGKEEENENIIHERKKMVRRK